MSVKDICNQEIVPLQTSSLSTRSILPKRFHLLVRLQTQNPPFKNLLDDIYNVSPKNTIKFLS